MLPGYMQNICFIREWFLVVRDPKKLQQTDKKYEWDAAAADTTFYRPF